MPASGTPAGSGRGPSAVRLSTAAHPAAARGHRPQPQEARPAVSGGEADGEASWRAQAGCRHARADRRAAAAERALELGLRLGPDDRRTAASASWRWSTTARANAWRWFPTPPCQEIASPGNSMPSSASAAGRSVSSATTERSSPQTPSWAGRSATRFAGITSLPANRSRTVSSRASTAGCGTRCSTRPCSAPWSMPVSCWPPGGAITICRHNAHLAMSLR